MSKYDWKGRPHQYLPFEHFTYAHHIGQIDSLQTEPVLTLPYFQCPKCLSLLENHANITTGFVEIEICPKHKTDKGRSYIMASRSLRINLVVYTQETYENEPSLDDIRKIFQYDNFSADFVIGDESTLIVKALGKLVKTNE